MSLSEPHDLLHDIAATFDELALKLGEGIKALADDENGTMFVSGLYRARAAAQRGAGLSRKLISRNARRVPVANVHR
jgi:hypothetical protein